MTSPKGMDELFWGRLEMTTKVQNYDEVKLFKIVHRNL